MARFHPSECHLTRSRASVLVQAMALAVPTLALAGAGFNSGSVTWSWDADTNSVNGGKTSFTQGPVSSGALPTSPTFQLNKSGSFGSAVATGKGSIGYVANATTASWTFAGGTGAAQNDPLNQFTGNTITKVNFGGLYDVTSPSFGPTGVGYFSLTAAGVAGVSGSTAIDFNVQWRLGGPTGTLLRSQVNDGTTFFGGVTGLSFSKTFTYGTAFSPSTIGTTSKIWVGGFLSLQASNGGTPSDVVPIQFEASAAPPTATFYGPAGGASDWHDPNTWAVPDNPAAGVFAFTEPGALVPQIPDGQGIRARVVNNASEPRALVLNAPVTLGALQIDENNSVFLESGAGTQSLNMDATTGNASIFIGATAGRGIHSISTELILDDSLDIRVETDQPGSGQGSVLIIDGPIGANGGPRDINVSGGGVLVLNQGNFYDGNLNISDGGTVRANSSGALSSGGAFVGNGRLEINDSQPFFSTGSQMSIESGGVLVLGVATFGNAQAVIAPGGGFAANPGILSQLSVGPGSGILLSPGSFVGHENIDTSPATNPSGLGSSPIYLYGLSADATTLGSSNITVGLSSSSPWVGLSSDGIDRAYGTDPNDPNAPILQFLGSGRLVAIGGDLDINARIFGGSETSVQISGSGVVGINSTNNQFEGFIDVLPDGALRVDGTLPQLQSILESGILGGNGSLAGTVIVDNQGRLDPGMNKYNSALGELTVHDLQLSNLSVLEFEFGEFDSDQVSVLGTLTLDGELLISQLQDFDNQGVYTLFTYSGALIDNGLTISPLSQPIDGVPAELAASILIIPNIGGPGGVVVLSVPEPGTVGLLTAGAGLLLRRRR